MFPISLRYFSKKLTKKDCKEIKNFLSNIGLKSEHALASFATYRILGEKLRYTCFSQVPTGSDYSSFRPIFPKILYFDFYSPFLIFTLKLGSTFCGSFRHLLRILLCCTVGFHFLRYNLRLMHRFHYGFGTGYHVSGSKSSFLRRMPLLIRKQ